MKRNIFKKCRIVTTLFAASLAAASFIFPAAAQAKESGAGLQDAGSDAMQFGADNIPAGSVLYYGKMYDKERGNNGRVLANFWKVLDNKQTSMGTPGMFLVDFGTLDQGGFQMISYNDVNRRNYPKNAEGNLYPMYYSDSFWKQRAEDFYNGKMTVYIDQMGEPYLDSDSRAVSVESFTPLEKERVLATYKDDAAYTPVSGWGHQTLAQKNILDGDHLFILSAKEAEKYMPTEGDRVSGDLWWNVYTGGVTRNCGKSRLYIENNGAFCGLLAA